MGGDSDMRPDTGGGGRGMTMGQDMENPEDIKPYITKGKDRISNYYKHSWI